MHPDDVAEHVAGEVADLRVRLAAAPELRAGDVELRNQLELMVPFTKHERPRLAAQIPGLSGGQLLAPGGGAIAFNYEVPDLSVRTDRQLILRCDCTDFDGQPPTAELLLADESPLPAAQWPSEMGRQAIVHNHPDYGRPFFCRRGLREYHSHPQHEDDPWDRYREAARLGDIVVELLHELQTRWILSR